MATPITPETVLADVDTLAEAKEIAREMKQTALIVSKAHGADHPTAVAFSDRYWDFVDAMAFKFAA